MTLRFLAVALLTASIVPLTPISARAENPYIQVGTAKTKKTVIALPEIRGSAGAKISEIILNDLTFMDLFKFLGASAFVEPKSAGIAIGSFKFSDWAGLGAEILVKGQVAQEGANFVLEGYVYDVPGAKQILGKRFVAAATDLKTLAHTFANNIVTALTGLPGIFLTKIAMGCDKTGKNEIYIMNFDGSDVKQITRHRSLAFAPAWSPDGAKIAYSLMTKHKNNVKNMDLWEFDFASETVRLLSNRKGINSGAAYSPDGTKIALTMSFLGNPDVFTLDPHSNTVSRITKSFGEDVDPAWSPDGRQMVFVSSRSGRPMVYRMNADGTSPQRLTFAGVYNATPSWSPTNNKLVFAGWLDKHFDIFLMNPDGTNIERLTKNQGNNEDPFFSPDGSFVVFSSNRTGQKNVYAMNVDGTFVKRLTYGMGNCVTPKWSAPPRTEVALPGTAKAQ